MTKKPSEKNKAWEKDRRDRLNKSFEELAKLLPKYDPSITWSKIEIIQKSIAHIKELHERHEQYLLDKNPEVLGEHSDLIDALNYYQARNGQLGDLLKKAKITLPTFKLPKFLIDNPQYLKNGRTKTTEIKTKSANEKSGKSINNKSAGNNSDNNTSKKDVKDTNDSKQVVKNHNQEDKKIKKIVVKNKNKNKT